MGRNKKRKLQEQGPAAAGGSVPATAAAAAPVPNGQNNAEPPPTADPPPDPPPSTQQQQPFCEPLHNLADDSASEASLLQEAATAVTTGPARLSDPRRVLHLMRHCAPRLSPAQLADRLTSWCQFLAGLLRSPRQLWCRDAACRTVARLLAEEARVEDAHRLLATGGLSQIITPLLESPELATPASLQCLRVILLHFGRGCGAQRGQLTRFLLQLFDTDKPGVSSAACRCVALLPHTGPSGTGGAAYAAAWNGQMRGLIRSAHEYLDRLLDGIVEVQAFDAPESGENELELPDVPESSPPDPIQLRYRLARRVSAVCRVAALMLGSRSKQPVSVPVTSVLELAQRCVSAGAAPASAAMELQATRRAMWDVRAAALDMLEALILSCGVHLLQRGSSLNRLLLSALQPSTAPHPSPAAEAAHRQALRSLRLWLLTAGAGCGLQEEAESLVKAVVEDVRPPQPAKVTLQTNPAATNGVTSNQSKKRKRGAADWLEKDLSSRESPPVPSRPRRCEAALAVLSQLVTSLGPLLKVPVHQTLQQLCVGLLLEIQQAGRPPPPYDSAGCRAGLYRVLRALVADPNPAWPAPTQFAGRLFAQGVRDPDGTVSALCQDGQALCCRVVQPTHPALFFPADLSSFSKPPSSGNTADATNPAEPVPSVITPPGGSKGPSDVTSAPDDVRGAGECAMDIASDPDDVRGAGESAMDIASDISECGSSDTVRLGSRLGFVTAAAAAVPSTPGDSRPATPPTQSASQGNQGSSKASQSTPGSSEKRSPSEKKPAGAWPKNRTQAPSGGPVTTVTIASSESGESADDRQSVELAETEEEDQKSIVLGGSEEDEDRREDGRRATPEEEDEVEILETKRMRRDTLDDEDLAPDVAEMLRDFKNEDPEVE